MKLKLVSDLDLYPVRVMTLSCFSIADSPLWSYICCLANLNFLDKKDATVVLDEFLDVVVEVLQEILSMFK